MKEKRPIWNSDEVLVSGHWREKYHESEYCFYFTRFWVASYWRKLPYPRKAKP